MFYERFCALCTPMRVERITLDNLSRVIALFASNPDYFSCVQSHPVDADECKADITMLPPGKTLADKTYMLVSDEQGDLAVIDFVERYPDDMTGYLGFLIVSGNRRGHGAGTQLLSMIEQAASACGLSRIELGCYETNTSGMAFWKGSGFSPIRNSKRETDGIVYTIVSMEKHIETEKVPE